MANKVIQLDELKKVPDMEKILQAFENFGNKRQPVVPVKRQEHLEKKFDPVYSCDHDWQMITDVEVLKRVVLALEEKEFNAAEYCSVCQALCLRDSKYRIFVYDATVSYRDLLRPPRTQQKRRQ